MAIKATKHFFQMLIEAKWFFTFTASVMATIVGISLTFGINSYRDHQRKKSEAKKLIVQAINNIETRRVQAEDMLEWLSYQDSLYQLVVGLDMEKKDIPDSTSNEAITALCHLQYNLHDVEFEKMFRNTYQIWQTLNQDSLTDLICKNFAFLNFLEPEFEKMNDGIWTQIYTLNAITPLFEHENALDQLLQWPQFRMYMANRGQMATGLRIFYDELNQTCKEMQTKAKDLGYIQDFVTHEISTLDLQQ